MAQGAGMPVHTFPFMFILLYIMTTPGASEAAKKRRCHLRILISVGKGAHIYSHSFHTEAPEKETGEKEAQRGGDSCIATPAWALQHGQFRMGTPASR